MADVKKVLLVHPDLPGAEFEAHPDAVASWMESGWKKAGTVVKSKTTTKKEK
jgi:hypothetical protein